MPMVHENHLLKLCIPGLLPDPLSQNHGTRAQESR